MSRNYSTSAYMKLKRNGHGKNRRKKTPTIYIIYAVHLDHRHIQVYAQIHTTLK